MTNGTSQGAVPTLTTLYSFTAPPDEVPRPGNLVIGPGGFLYGTTFEGGSVSECLPGCGTVFSLTPPAQPGDEWAEMGIYNFPGNPVGAFPIALLVDNNGVLYGLTQQGGSYLGGTAFSLTPPAEPGGSWSETVLHSFGSGGDEIQPYSLVEDGGVLYGTGVSLAAEGASVVFSLAPGGESSWTETVLHSFYAPNRSLSLTGLAIGRGGVLYGGLVGGGLALAACNIPCGSLFSLTPPAQSGDSWTETVLYNFLGPPNDGESPELVVVGSDGVLYGTTSSGGTGNTGIVYSLSPPEAGGFGSETVLHNFFRIHGMNRFGVNPDLLVSAPRSGVLYGATEYNGYSAAGTLYSLTPPLAPGGNWAFNPLLDFDSTDGRFPDSLVGTREIFYGSTGGGGAYGNGTVFSFVP